MSAALLICATSFFILPFSARRSCDASAARAAQTPSSSPFASSRCLTEFNRAAPGEITSASDISTAEPLTESEAKSGRGVCGASAAWLSPNEVFLEFGGVSTGAFSRRDLTDMERDGILGGLVTCFWVFDPEKLDGSNACDNGSGRWDGENIFGGESTDCCRCIDVVVNVPNYYENLIVEYYVSSFCVVLSGTVNFAWSGLR